MLSPSTQALVLYGLFNENEQVFSPDQVGRYFRATKDLDIVLCVEALDADFVNAFWDFNRQGRYKNQQKSTGRKLFYRFYNPEEELLGQLRTIYGLDHQ